ncbi:MAG: SPFH domain-containing protein [Anaerolineales bacterium]|jgi:excisionase family DNA binding protein
MARIFDVVEYPDEMRDEIVHRFPESGFGDFRIGSQVIVREAQSAVFFRDGRALDTFKAGRHTITTANVPFLVDLIGKAFNERTPFTAEVYFVSMREFADQKWGTAQPIIIRNPGMGLGVALMQGFGSYSFQVANPQQFVAQIVGTTGAYSTADIQGRLRAILLSKLSDLLGETAAKKDVPALIGLTEELGAGVRAKAQDDFKAVGLTLKSFYIENLKPSEKSAEELRAMGMLDMATYTQLQAADAMRDAAKNPSGGAGLTAGIGAGMSIGQVMGEALKAGASKADAASTAAASLPDVMTVADVASLLKVSEEDVLELIKSKELKAKKIGKAYRVGKAAFEEYLGK